MELEQENDDRTLYDAKTGACENAIMKKRCRGSNQKEKMFNLSRGPSGIKKL